MHPWQRAAGLGVALIIASTGSSRVVTATNHDLRLPAPLYPAVVELRDAGRQADALAELDRRVAGQDPVPVEAVLLRATLLETVNRPMDAEPLWRMLAGREPSLRTHALRSLVVNLSRRGDTAGAQAALDQLIERAGLPSNRDLAIAVADAWRSGGDQDTAIALYRRVLGPQPRGTDADRARLGLAASLEGAGDITGAMTTLREAQLQHASASTHATARAGEDRLLATLGRRRDPWTEPQYRTLVQRLRGQAAYGAARRLIEEWRASHPSSTQPDVIDAELIETLYTMRANDEAIAACDRFVRVFPQSRQVPDVLLTRFRLDVRLGRTDQAREQGLALLRGRVPGADAGHRRNAGVLLAAYLVSVGDVEGGLDLYRELFQQAATADDQRDFLWKAGVAALRVGQVDRALANLRALMARRPSGDLEPAGLYWLGVAAEAAGDVAEAQRAFRDLETRFRFHYYGVRAAERLDVMAGAGGRPPTPENPIAFPAVALADAVVGHPQFTAARVFARAGLRVEAATQVADLLRARGDTALALLAARAAADAQDYRAVSGLVATYFPEYLTRPASSLPEDFWQLVYPRPFWDEVKAAAARHGLDPIWMLAIMRQESRFDPRARSAVGAIGLFQIMPYTAEALADRVAGLERGTPIDESLLMQPSINAAFAAHLARSLIDMFDQSLEPVAASYNAGEDRVSEWWKHSREAGHDMFVDLIPYTETRRFVREVLENYWSYRRIYEN